MERVCSSVREVVLPDDPYRHFVINLRAVLVLLSVAAAVWVQTSTSHIPSAMRETVASSPPSLS